VFATRAHFDYRDEQARTQLAEWLSDARLDLHSVHAPAFEALRNGRWVGPLSTASGDETRRKAAIAEAEAALLIARHVPFRYLVAHLGIPVGEQVPHNDNRRDAARRSVEDLVALAARANVQVALEVIPNPLSSAAALCHLIEEELDGVDVGICLDYGHAHLIEDVGEAIETLSGHLWTTHVHDNGGKRDDHLVPFAGTIDWDLAMMATQKIGYDGMLMLEVGDGGGDPVDVLKRSVKARERLEKSFVIF
jgi:sugar phosphate isomerase/epimerase